MRLLVKMGLMALCGLGLAQAAQAEEGGMVYYSAGGNLINPAPLNTLISAQGYKAYDSWNWGQGIGLYGIFQRFLVGAEYQSLFGQLSSSGQESLKLEGSYGLFQLGYVVAGASTFQIYPYVGIGPGFVTLRSSQALNGMLSMTQGSNANLLSASGMSWLLDLGVGANVTVPMSTGSDARGPSVSLRAGYLLTLGGTQWSSNELPVTGGPALNPGGPYVRLMVGFGGYQ
jgi:hypothetical protein